MTCPYCDQKEKGRGKGETPIPITPDQYDRLSRRIYVVEQMTADWQKYSLSVSDMENIYRRLNDMNRKIEKIEKMFIKIGIKLFKRAVPDRDKLDQRLTILENGLEHYINAKKA